MCYTQICPRFECRDEHTIHTCVYCVLTLNAGPGKGVCVCVCVFLRFNIAGTIKSFTLLKPVSKLDKRIRDKSHHK